MTYKPLSDEKLVHLVEISNASTTHYERSMLIEQCKRANALQKAVEHAIELGYLGVGSTANWVKKELAAYRGEDDPV